MQETEATTITSRPHEERGRRGVAQTVDLVVDGRVLLDVGVGRREVRLGLVVVVVRDEELDPVLREQLPQLGGQLGGQRLVRLDDERRPLDLLDHPGDRRRLPGAGDPLEGLVGVARAGRPRPARRWPPAGHPTA